MKKSLKILPVLVAALFLIQINFVKAEEIKSPSTTTPAKTQIQKIKKIDGTFATEKEIKRQQELVDKLNKSTPPTVFIKSKDKLTVEEWKERLKFLQSLEKYDLQWYYDYMRGFDWDKCNDTITKPDPRCRSFLLLPILAPNQVISILINFDSPNYNFENITFDSSGSTMDNIVKDILTNGIEYYVYQEGLYSNIDPSSNEIYGLLEKQLILNKYKK